MSFCLLHRDIGITLTWSLVKRDRAADSIAFAKAMEACALATWATTHPVRSPSSQKKLARRRVATMWSNKWTHDRRAKLGTGGHTAYDLAILSPPDGTNHSLWNTATKKFLGFPPSYIRHTTTTAFRLAAGHAFTSTYARLSGQTFLWNHTGAPAGTCKRLLD